MPGFLGVHRLEAPTFGGAFGGSNAVCRLMKHPRIMPVTLKIKTT